jgi:ketosteroid isomerase-like protein
MTALQPPGDRDASTTDALLSPAAFVEAHWRAAIERRIDDVAGAYADSDDTYVFPEGPRWSTRGRPAIETGWKAYLQAPFRLTSHTWVEGPLQGASGAFGWCAGVAEFGVTRGAEATRVRFRFSFVLQRAGDRWRIVHEHFSQPAADPYGTGDWLKASG